MRRRHAPRIEVKHFRCAVSTLTRCIAHTRSCSAALLLCRTRARALISRISAWWCYWFLRFFHRYRATTHHATHISMPHARTPPQRRIDTRVRVFVMCSCAFILGVPHRTHTQEANHHIVYSLVSWPSVVEAYTELYSYIGWNVAHGCKIGFYRVGRIGRVVSFLGAMRSDMLPLLIKCWVVCICGYAQGTPGRKCSRVNVATRSCCWIIGLCVWRSACKNGLSQKKMKNRFTQAKASSPISLSLSLFLDEEIGKTLL